MPELADVAGIFVGETAEALSDLEYAVMRGRVSLADAQRVMSEALKQVARHYAAASASNHTRPKGRRN
jgi:hypothetical protein